MTRDSADVTEHPAPLSGRRPDELWEHKRGKVWRIIERIEHEKRALVWANAVLRARIRRLTMQAKRRDEMHSAASETISEEIGRIVDYGKKQGSFSLTIALDEKGDYSTAFIFGREAPDSPMAAGASYGYGDSIPACLTQMIDECRIPPRETLGY